MFTFAPSLGKNIASIFRGGETAAFNLRFSQLQNTVIRRLNEKTQGIADSDNVTRRRETLIKESKTLRDTLDGIGEYIFINDTNAEQLSTAFLTAATLLDVISREDADTNVTNTEVFDFESVRNKLAGEIDKLQFIVHPDLERPDLIQEIIALGQELTSKNLVQGVVDVEGTVNTTNNNRPIQDFVTQLQNKINSGIFVTSNAVEIAKNVRFSLFADVAENQTDRLSLAQSEIKRKEIEIEKEKERAGTLLQAISLSFEIRKIQTDTLNESLLGDRRVPLGSILNIFL